MVDITKLNKKLQEFLTTPGNKLYNRASNYWKQTQKLLENMGIKKNEDAEIVEDALNYLAHEDEVAINMRFNKQAILENPELAEFVSLLFDVCEQWEQSQNEHLKQTTENGK